jgi:hypothetical protein
LQIAVDRVADFSFLQAGEQEFEHHVIGEQDVGRVLLHVQAERTVFLACVLAYFDGELAACGILVICFVDVEFVGLSS